MTCCLNIYGRMRHDNGGESSLQAESWQMLERRKQIRGSRGAPRNARVSESMFWGFVTIAVSDIH